MKHKIPIIVKKLQVAPFVDKIGESRVSERLQTQEHLIRDIYSLRKNYY